MFRALVYNVGYFRGIDGSLAQHFIKGHRHLFSRRSLQHRLFDSIQPNLSDLKPDLCMFVEIDKGSINNAFLDQLPVLAKKNGYDYFEATNKYAIGSRASRAPYFSGKSNGFMSKEPVTVEKRYLSSGMKRLVYEITTKEGLKFFLVHLDLTNPRTRAEQLKEIAAWVKGKERTIVCGDFNIFKGVGELKDFLNITGFTLMNNPDHLTYPAHAPLHALDLCLCSSDMASKAKLSVIEDLKASDHLAVVLDVYL